MKFAGKWLSFCGFKKELLIFAIRINIRMNTSNIIGRKAELLFLQLIVAAK